jgi:hypothetical protein
MQIRRHSEDKRRLRKQPRMRRMESAAPVAQPRLQVPKKAKKRRKRSHSRNRNRPQIAVPTSGIKQVVLSARWLSLALLLLMVFSIYVAGQSEDFYLTDIPVIGTSSIPAWEIVEASRLGGMHIFAANPAKAAEAVTKVPGVVSASVQLEWPNVVTIQIEEDSPVAIWVEGEHQYWVTREGDFIPARSAAPGLLQIDSKVPKAAAVTAVLAANSEGVGGEGGTETAVSTTPAAQAQFIPQDVLVGALQLQQLRPNIGKLSFEPGNGLSYQDGRGWTAYFGSGNDMAQKLVVYEKIVEELTAQGVTPVYISVSNQERPYYYGSGN